MEYMNYCTDCKLKFADSKAFERHKAKFCTAFLNCKNFKDERKTTNSYDLLNRKRDIQRDYHKNGGRDTQILHGFHNHHDNLLSYKQNYEQRNCAYEKEMKRGFEELENAKKTLAKEVELLREKVKDIQRSTENRAQQMTSKAQARNHSRELSQRRRSAFHSQQIEDLQNETQIYRHQLELERLKAQIYHLYRPPGGHFTGLQQPPEHFANAILPPVFSRPPYRIHENNRYFTNNNNYNYSDDYDNVAHAPVILSNKGDENKNYEQADKIDVARVHSHQVQKKIINMNKGTSVPKIFEHRINESWANSAPYDPKTGFCCFWDFVKIGKQLSDHGCIATTLVHGNSQTKETVFPHFHLEPSFLGRTTRANSIGVLGIKQQVSSEQPDPLTKVCVRVYMARETSRTVDTWCMFNPFTDVLRLQSGRWKIPLRKPPVNVSMTTNQTNQISQYFEGEVYVRLTNTRDAENLEACNLDSQQMADYSFMPPANEQPNRYVGEQAATEDKSSIFQSKPSSYNRRNISKHTRRPTNFMPSLSRSRSVLRNQSTKEVLVSVHHSQSDKWERNLGIQVNFVSEITNPFLQQVQCSLFNAQTKVVQIDDKPIKCNAKLSKSTFLYGVTKFSHPQIYHKDVEVNDSSFLLFEVKDEHNNLVAWSSTGLDDDQQIYVSSTSVLQEKQKHLPLYKPPLMKLSNLKLFMHGVMDERSSFDMSGGGSYSRTKEPTRLDKGTLCVSLSTSPVHHHPVEAIPQLTPRKNPPTDCLVEYSKSVPTAAYKPGDAFDVYLDTGRCFPDSTCAVKVVMGVYDANKVSKKNPFVSLFESTPQTDSNCFEPLFKCRWEFRDLTYTPNTKLVFSVYILDEVSGKVVILGRSILPLFLVQNTFDGWQKEDETPCLNAGAFQLRLYQSFVGYNETTVDSPVACCSILVRIHEAACHNDGYPKTLEEYPEDQGLVVPIPPYEQGNYDSTQLYPPSWEEVELYHYLHERPQLTCLERCKASFQDNKRFKTEQAVQEWINQVLSKTSDAVLFSSRYLAKYSPTHGLFIHVEGVQNIHWNGFTVASYFLLPPASYVFKSNEDLINIVGEINGDCEKRHPTWVNNPIKVFPRRSYYSNMCVVVLVHEVVMENSTFKINNQAWSFLPLFTNGYIAHAHYQLPLFRGPLTQEITKELLQSPQPLSTVLTARKKKYLKPIDRTSIFVRVGDARKMTDWENLPMDTAFLPSNKSYTSRSPSKHIRSILPLESPDNFFKTLHSAYQKLVSLQPSQKT